MNEVITLKNVIKLYGQRRVINGVDLYIKEKERMSVTGASGSGKSTLLKLIAGMERPSGGEIYVLGKAVHDMSPDVLSEFRNVNIGIMLKEPGFIPELSLIDNVALPLTARGAVPVKREKAAKEMLQALGVSHAVYSSPEKLSFYEARIASLARALVAQPKILLFDEVAAGFSERETEKLKDVVNGLSELGDYTILSFSAAGNDILHAGRNAVLYHGIIKEDKQ